jgi:colanic acid/amylovoran biosynthesis glycosyltransferase
LDRGHEVEIYATARRDLPTIHPAISEYRLTERTLYFSDLPKNYPRRIRAALTLLIKDSRWLKLRTWQLLFQILRNRRKAPHWGILNLLAIALPNVGKPPHDILHCQFGNLGPRVLFLKQIGVLKGRLLTSFRGHDATQQRFTNSGMYRELFEAGDLFLPVSSDLGERLMAMGCDRDKVRVLHSGIDRVKFAFKARSRTTNEPTRVLSIARFVEMKGLEYGLRAVAQLIESGHAVTYTIIGNGTLRRDLESLTETLGIGENVRFLGWKNHEAVIDTMRVSHILLAPSVTPERGETEGIPNVVKEAMATGMPVVSTIHGGIPELVEDGVSGFLVAERDVDGLANRLAYLIKNPNVWPKMGEAGRARIEAEFDTDKLNDLLVTYYNQSRASLASKNPNYISLEALTKVEE